MPIMIHLCRCELEGCPMMHMIDHTSLTQCLTIVDNSYPLRELFPLAGPCSPLVPDDGYNPYPSRLVGRTFIMYYVFGFSDLYLQPPKAQKINCSHWLDNICL